MSDHYQRGPRLKDAFHHLQHLDGGRVVERCRRLVGKDEEWTLYDGPGDGDALLLSTRHLRGIVPHAVGQAYESKSLGCRHGIVHQLTNEVEVLARIEVWHEVVALKDKANVGTTILGQLALRRAHDLFAHELDRATRGSIQPRHDVHDRGLATARLAQQDKKLSPVHVEVYPLEHVRYHVTAHVVARDAPGQKYALAEVLGLCQRLLFGERDCGEHGEHLHNVGLFIRKGAVALVYDLQHTQVFGHGRKGDGEHGGDLDLVFEAPLDALVTSRSVVEHPDGLLRHKDLPYDALATFAPLARDVDGSRPKVRTQRVTLGVPEDSHLGTHLVGNGTRAASQGNVNRFRV